MIIPLYCPTCRIEFEGDIYCPQCKGIVDCIEKCCTPSCKVAIFGGNVWEAAHDDFNQPAVLIGANVYCSQCAPLTSSPASQNGGTISEGALSRFQGEWHSPQYKYAFEMIGNKGLLTVLNFPESQNVGDDVFRITSIEENRFIGRHAFSDLTWKPVDGELLSDQEMRIRGTGLDWVMQRS